ncbi:U32 family peptidase [Desulfovibrio inopinatus]|uniref:U32 family peptidase n=1 Tax=Desulfovibrio inopinatus TaxID=102109 RepID=UPI0003F4D975|nr:U32 family peptidase [Desulfovibrio inopinatus]
MHRSELLVPAGSLEKLKVALLYGADAIYMGTPDMSLRTRSQFSLEQVIEGVRLVHAHGKKAYLTLNLFSHNRDIEKLPLFIETIRKVRPDGVIIADPGVFQFVKENAPDLEIHISTQANVCSYLSVDFWKKMGADLVVLAREVSFHELTEIRTRCPDVKLEVFIHGAMCMTYSGRCLLSNFLAQRGANQGNCTNSCRWQYKMHVALPDGTLEELTLTDENKDLFRFFLEEKERPGEFFPIEEDEKGAYILNSKDLCLMPHLEAILQNKIDSLKIEGRNRSAYYVAVTTRAYRQAIDAFYKDPDHWSPDPYMQELRTIPVRGYTHAFHEGRLTHHAHDYEGTNTLAAYEFAGLITEVTDDAFYLDVKNRILSGDVLEFIAPSVRTPMRLRIYQFEDVRNDKTYEDAIHAGEKPLLKIPFAWLHEEDPARLAKDFPPYTIVRKRRMLSDQEQQRLKMDLTAQAVEMGQAPEAAYQKRLTHYKRTQKEAPPVSKGKGPALGRDGCCGCGCNGCLHFWHDPAFEQARAKLREKKPGELLTKQEYRGGLSG